MEKGFKNIEGFANIDLHREERTGYPETVFCPGKTSEQIAKIMKELSLSGKNVIATRATPENFGEIQRFEDFSGLDLRYYEAARIIAIVQSGPAAGDGKSDAAGTEGSASADPASTRSASAVSEGTIAVVTAGTADIPVAEEAAVTAELLGNRVDRIYDVGVSGIHRLFDKLDRIRAARVVIVIAGMEGALASVVGGLVSAPVIAVPTSIGYGANLGGLSALLSMLNSCANGVVCVNIDNGYGAAYTASLINRG